MAGESRVSFTYSTDLGALGAQVGPILAREAASLTRRISAQAKMNVPVLTGNLGRSIEEDAIRFVGPFRVETGVTAKANYAGFVHDGTRPHVIRARPGGVLAFPGAGGTVYAASVRHPGTRPRPFLKNAADEVVASR